MATGEQLKALLQSHFNNDEERFITMALQIAAYEAKLGRTNVATDVRKIIDRAKTSLPRLKPLNKELEGVLLETVTPYTLKDLIVPNQQIKRIERLLGEFHQRQKLRLHGLENRRKVLLEGPPGTGKTMTASIIANELDLPLYTIMMDKMITRFMGETSAKLRQVFETIKEKRAVYLFDEFDAIGGERGRENDVGEMRRVLNSFLQFLEKDDSDSIIIAATNIHDLLDHALFRRFDDVLHYENPSLDEVIELLTIRLGSFRGKISIKPLAKSAIGLSHAEITRVCIDSIKESILVDKKTVDRNALIKNIVERQNAYIKFVKP